MASLVLEVSAVANASLTSVFKSFVAEGQKAARQVSAAFAGAAQGAAKGAQAGGDVVVAQAARGAKAQTEAARQGTEAVRSASKTQAELIRSVQEQRNRDHKQFLDELREQEREAKKAAKSAAKEKREAAAAQRKEDASRKRVGSAALRTFGGYMATGLSVGRTLASGAGIDLSVAGNMGRAHELQTAAGDATRSAFTARGQIATAEDIRRTVDAIRRGGDEAKASYGDLAAGMTAFVAKSADIETANATLGRMGILAKATGTNVRDLLSSAGDVNRELDDGPDRAERLMSIMRLVAKQGAMGNVEIRDLARYMGRITATSFMYEGGKDQNIGILGALAQVSMKGGAASAAEATRSAAAFARDLTKSSSLKNFDEAGIEVFSDKAKTKLKTPEKIITEFLEKTNGDLSKLSTLFKNDASRKVVLGFSNIYASAGGGAKGVEAVRAEFRRMSTTMSEGEVNAQAKTALEDPAARAQAIQNRLETLAATTLERVLPSLEKLAPHAERAAEALAAIVSFGAQNPGMLITGAIIASIAKAQLQERLGDALSKLLGGLGPKGGLAIGVATIAIAAATIAANKVGAGADAARDQVKSDEQILTGIEAEFNKTGTLSEASITKLKELRERVREHKASGQNAIVEEDSALGAFGAGVKRVGRWMSSDQSWDDIGKEVGYRDTMGNVTSQEKGIDALLRAIENQKNGVQRVHVDNAADLKDGPAGPGVDQGARSSGVN